ncbi:nucleotidyltransferase domain-containing protein [Candidatus Woesearchaeota archaeon]|nr:nucleotidyltransferase domain-containing protein [Candidatus Woesearchaeota archaeon]
MVDKTTDNKLRILSLYRSNYLAQYHTREMAKLTKKSHVTLLPHLNTLKKDKILIAKMTGKNKVYTLNLDNVLTKNYIIISELLESILFQEQVFLIKKITTEIFKLNFSGSIVLFGSYAKKTFKEDSDIDLFYLGELKEVEISKIKAIGKTYGKIINLKTATCENFESGLRKKDALIMEILKYHIILQNADSFINALWRYYHEIRG